MNTLPLTAAFDVRFDPLNGKSCLECTFTELSNAPRLPVDLTLVAIEIRKILGWKTLSLQAALEEGIGEGTLNPVHANLHAVEGSLFARVNRDGSGARIVITPHESIHRGLESDQLRSILEASTPFMPPMNDPLWTPPGLDDPHMKVNRNPDPEAHSPEIGWPADFAMPWSYARMGQEVNGDMTDCLWLPDDAESLFVEFIKAAFVTRVSIMGVFSGFDAKGNGHASLAISESDMELMIMPHLRRVYATFFTCGNSNPRPAIDVLHNRFNAALTEVRAMVRGWDVPYHYEGVVVRGGTGQTCWKDKPMRMTAQRLLGDKAT